MTMNGGASVALKRSQFYRCDIGCFGSAMFPRSNTFSYRFVSDDMPDIMKQPWERLVVMGSQEKIMQFVLEVIAPLVDKYKITHWAAYKNIGEQSMVDIDISKDEWMLSMEEHLAREKAPTPGSRPSSPRLAPVVPFPAYAKLWDTTHVWYELVAKFDALSSIPGTCESVHLVLFNLPTEEGGNTLAIGMNVTCKTIEIRIT
jgi:hypothetical protein